MEDTIVGLTPEAQTYLAEHRLLPGEHCWCCGLPIADDYKAPVIKTIEGAQGKYTLHRYILRTPGMVAEEELQAAIAIPDKKEIRYYLALRIRPDGILAHGEGQRIQWSTDDWLVLFK